MHICIQKNVYKYNNIQYIYKLYSVYKRKCTNDYVYIAHIVLTYKHYKHYNHKRKYK